MLRVEKESSGLKYRIEAVRDKKHIVITGMNGNDECLFIPDFINDDGDEIPVRIIGKKAFMSCKIREVRLGKNIAVVEDWAFAYCESLAVVSCDKKDVSVTFGRGVFDGCKRLNRLCIGAYEEPLPYLMAMTVRMLKTDEFIKADTENIKLWYERLDGKITEIINAPDDEGYYNNMLGGEEDISKTREGYAVEQILFKLELAVERLIFDEGIDAGTRQGYVDYICLHMKGCPACLTWRLIKEKYADSLRHFRLLTDIGAIKDQNIDMLLDDLGEGHGEIKAYLIKHKQENGLSFIKLTELYNL